jgi:hypothetical protein
MNEENVLIEEKVLKDDVMRSEKKVKYEAVRVKNNDPVHLNKDYGNPNLLSEDEIVKENMKKIEVKKEVVNDISYSAAEVKEKVNEIMNTKGQDLAENEDSKIISEMNELGLVNKAGFEAVFMKFRNLQRELKNIQNALNSEKAKNEAENKKKK